MADPTAPTISIQQCIVKADGTASVRVQGAPPIKAVERDRSRSRGADPEATGYYEADEPSDVFNSKRTLFLNQAGRALVGWMAVPPRFVQPIQDFAVRYAILVADLTEKTAQGYPFWYVFYENATDFEKRDPNAVLDPYDPPNRGDPADTGFLEIHPASDSWDYLEIKLAVRLTFSAHGDASIWFHHVDPGARAAQRTIGFQDQPLRDILIATHQQPIPASYFDRVHRRGADWASAIGLFDPSGAGPLADAIRRYWRNKDADAYRKIACRNISDLLSFRWDSSPPHARLLNLTLARLAQETRVAVEGDPPRSYREWLVAIAFNELSLNETVPENFAKLTVGAQIYRYVCTFESKLAGATVFTALRGAIGGFALTIERLVAALPEDGPTPSDDRFAPVGGRNRWETEHYFGAFLSLKAGISDPPSLPQRIHFDWYELLPDDDFNGAFFELYAADATITGGPSLPVPVTMPGLTIGGKVQRLRIHTKSGAILDQAFAEGQIVPKPQTPWQPSNLDLDELKKLLTGRGLSKPTWHSESAGVTLGVGWIGYQDGFASWMRAPPRPGTQTVLAEDGRTITAMFEVNRATLRAKANDWSVRFLLETVLATDLALYTGSPEVDIRGSASPEYTPCYNLVLSEERALAIKFAMMDALPLLQESQVRVEGLADELALAAGLHRSDPTGDPGGRASFPYKEEIDEWPEYRRADIDVMGRFAIRVITVRGA